MHDQPAKAGNESKIIRLIPALKRWATKKCGQDARALGALQIAGRYRGNSAPAAPCLLFSRLG
jgi:hypothetical protein